MTYNEFKTAAERLLSEYVNKCVEAGSLTQEFEDTIEFQELIDNDDYLKSTDRIEVSSPEESDTRFSVYYGDNEMYLDVVDTSC